MRKLTLFVLLMLLVTFPTAAQDGAPAGSGPWQMTGSTPVGVNCIPPEQGGKATVTGSGNSAVYTYTFPEAPDNAWVFALQWREPEFNSVTGQITSVASVRLENQGPFAGPAPHLQIFTDPGAYTVKGAGAVAAGGVPSGTDTFEAIANPVWDTPFDVVVRLSAHDCDGELVRYHFQRQSAADAEATQAADQAIEDLEALEECDDEAETLERLRQEEIRRSRALADTLARAESARLQGNQTLANELSDRAARAQQTLIRAQARLANQAQFMMQMGCTVELPAADIARFDQSRLQVCAELLASVHQNSARFVQLSVNLNMLYDEIGAINERLPALMLRILERQGQGFIVVGLLQEQEDLRRSLVEKIREANSAEAEITTILSTLRTQAQAMGDLQCLDAPA